MRRASPVITAMMLLAGSQLIPELLQPGLCYGVTIKHVDMSKLNKLQDSLTPEQFQDLTDRANEIERMIKAGPPRLGNEYDGAIQMLEDQAKQLAQERKDIRSQNEQLVGDELKRLDSTYEQYSHDISEQQRQQFLTTATELQARWANPDWESKSVNQAIADSSQLLTDIRKLSSTMIEMASIAPGKKSGSSLPVRARRPTPFVGAPLDQEQVTLERPGFMDTDEIVPDYKNSYKNAPFIPPKTTVDTISKSLSDLRIHLDGLNRINVLGTFEYESLSQQWNDLLSKFEPLKGSNTLDNSQKTALMQTLQNKIKELRSTIDNAATK